MGITLDTSDVRGLAARITGNAGRLGVRSSALLRKTAFDIERDAKILAPVDTGALQGSISTSITGDGRSAGMTAEIGPTVEYGIYLEFGTSRAGAQPYMGPAFDRRAPAFAEGLARLAEEAI